MDPYGIFSIHDESRFLDRAKAFFAHQKENNPVFKEFLMVLGRNQTPVHHYTDIPALPVEFFKSRKVVSGSPDNKLFFESSGTTGQTPSRHYISDLRLYEASFSEGFRQFYGDPQDWVILALLPSYLEREHSSLVYMVKELIRQSGSPESGFFLNETDKLARTLESLHQKPGKKILLLGVSFALLDFASRYTLNLKGITVMETGGMKGRQREMIRPELHEVLMSALGVDSIHSEYGMTEMLSQAYSTGGGRFRTPPWLRVYITHPEDPLVPVDSGKEGLINIVDLANYHSCCFLATRDLGRLYPDGSFEVIGRHDLSDLRGCNLMVSNI